MKHIYFANLPVKRLLVLFLFIHVLTLSNCRPVSGEEYSQFEKFDPAELQLPVTDPYPPIRNLHADHYPSSNEHRIDLFRERLTNLNGGYVGVGTDQNFTFIAWARSDWAYLTDFDPIVVAVNRIHFYFIEISPTYEEYEQLWLRKNKNTSYKKVLEHFKDDKFLPYITKGWQVAQRGWNDVPERLRTLKYLTRRFHLRSFHNDPDDYNHLRKMVQEKRIQAVSGNLLGSITLKEIAKKSRELEIPLRILYMSNAEEYFKFPPNFRENIIAQFVDEKSLVVRTSTAGSKSVMGYPEGEKFPDEYPFHYNIQPILNFQEYMKLNKDFKLLHMIRHATRLDTGYSIMEKSPEEIGWTEKNGGQK